MSKIKVFSLKIMNLKTYIWSGMYRDQEFQCVKKKKKKFNQVRRHENVFQSKFVRLFYKNHGLGEKHRTICSLIFLG